MKAAGAWVLRLAVLLAAALLLAPCRPALALELTRMQALAASQASPPPDDRAWAEVALPGPVALAARLPRGGAVWYRASFDAPALGERDGSWAVYLPYLYEGGQVWLNGTQVGEVEEDSDAVHVRWERPHLIALPRQVLRAGDNVLAVRAAALPSSVSQRFPVVSVAPLAELLPVHERRLFWVRTLPEITVVVCLLMAAIVLCIWWRRRSEVLYGLFGLASALWGVRTLTFVIERMPAEYWPLWRTVYLGATGGFVVVLALFSLRLAGIGRPWLRGLLLGYWLLGPAWLLLAGAQAEPLVNRWWSAGLIPIGLAILAVSIRTVATQRTLAAALMPMALMIAVLAGVHDYLVAWDNGTLARLLPHWAGQRIFLLHHAANLLLLCMGSLLTARFIRTMDSLEELNRTLETRVADRERHLAESFARMAQLQRQHAASQERQSIMREIHDGLGSRLFTSLSRVERGDMSERQIADMLRDCIADMRIALDALAPDAGDFRTALGNFLFRWQAQLEEARVQPSWTIDVPDSASALSPQASLQLLRIAQEALTNVLKHARAGRVRVQLRQRDALLELEIADDGQPPATAPAAGGRGIANMHARARQLGASLEVVHAATGTRVLLRVPFADHRA
uniref:sensor histidine kinase n=1 Tax=unclassified Variovorax TaxID=663243 RepID=UPI000D382CE0